MTVLTFDLFGSLQDLRGSSGTIITKRSQSRAGGSCELQKHTRPRRSLKAHEEKNLEKRAVTTMRNNLPQRSWKFRNCFFHREPVKLRNNQKWAERGGDAVGMCSNLNASSMEVDVELRSTFTSVADNMYQKGVPSFIFLPCQL